MVKDLFWLPPATSFETQLKALKNSEKTALEKLRELQRLAALNLDFVQTMNLHRYALKIGAEDKTAIGYFQKIKVALLSTTTIDHLIPSMWVGAFRRGLLIDWYIAPYNQYRQEILEPESGLYRFKPEIILFLMHESELAIRLPLDSSTETVDRTIQVRLDEWVDWWKQLKNATQAEIIQSTLVIPTPQLFGHFDATVAASPTRILSEFNRQLGRAAAQHKIHLLDLDDLASRVGKYEWCAASLWHHAKQDIPVACSPLFGDYTGRIMAGLRGLSRKCLVLDLDGTVWGGVIGDDGLDGIQLGQGTGVGESFIAFQTYVKQLHQRGVIVAVCSKNDEVNALLPFLQHPEMILKREDIAFFMANWDDKAGNIQKIAAALQIGLDSMVFFDNDAGERQWVRELLPMVAVPEVPEDAADYVLCLSESGYFEAGSFTAEDKARTHQYHALAEQHKATQTGDLHSFLKSLNMTMSVAPFDETGIQRIVQLINKSNQFNLTTRRRTEGDILQMLRQPDVLTFQVRLTDRVVDHGMISILIAEPSKTPKTLWINTWLMSCRVLGRQVEKELLNVLVDHAKRLGYERLQGEFIPTEKNKMVRDHYTRLGFTPLMDAPSPSTFWWQLETAAYKPFQTVIQSQYLQKTPS